MYNQDTIQIPNKFYLKLPYMYMLDTIFITGRFEIAGPVKKLCVLISILFDVCYVFQKVNRWIKIWNGIGTINQLF